MFWPKAIFTPRGAEIRPSCPLNNPFRVEGNVPATEPRAALTLALGYGEESLWASGLLPAGRTRHPKVWLPTIVMHTLAAGPQDGYVLN